MPKSQFSQHDNVHIYLHGPDGTLKDERHTHNLVVTAGKNWLAAYLANVTNLNMVYLAIGTGTTAPTPGDTALGGDVSNPRVVGTLTSSNNMWQNTATYPANNPSSTVTMPVTEAGILNNTTGGNMYVRSTFAAVNKQPADTLTIVWQVTNS